MNRTLNELIQAATRRNIRHSFPAGIPSDEFLELSKGERRIILHKTRTPFLSSVSAKLATDKYLSGQYLQQAGFPVAEKRLSSELSSEDFSFLEKYPEIVVKPNRADRGLGVTLKVASKDGLIQAFTKAKEYGSVLLERYVRGNEYRILVIDGVAAAVLEWQPTLELTENMTPGGEIAIDRTGEAHREILDLAIRAAALFEMDVVGIDLIAKDIAKPITESEPILLELNPSPDFLAHLYPGKGQPQAVADRFLAYLFPED